MIKDDSELRHALAHFWLAVDYLSKGEVEAARYELEGIEGLIFFHDEAERLKYLKGDHHGIEPMHGQTAEAQQEESETPPKVGPSA